MKILTVAEMREVDRLSTERFGISGLTLMENAGASVAHFIAERFSNLSNRRIAVLCLIRLQSYAAKLDDLETDGQCGQEL